MRYELHYWPTIQGRGEFVRLALEEAAAPYVDVARGKDGEANLARELGRADVLRPPFAPPFLKAGKRVIAQTANILLYLGDHHGLAPRDEGGRLWTNQLQLTLADLVTEAHDAHHPTAASMYYEEQKREAKKRAANFLAERVPKFLGYFERVLAANARSSGPSSKGGLVGPRVTYADLSLFQVVAGLRYAYPNAMARIAKAHPRVVALAHAVAERPRIAAYLASPRRIRFNEQGIFRHYPELDP